LMHRIFTRVATKPSLFQQASSTQRGGFNPA